MLALEARVTVAQVVLREPVGGVHGARREPAPECADGTRPIPSMRKGAGGERRLDAADGVCRGGVYTR
ncbi:MAG: hypothetical protein ACAI18_06850 [Gemmatimonadales bacterium]